MTGDGAGANLFGAAESEGTPSVDRADRALIDAYVAANRTLDDLPYTAELTAIIESLRRAGDVRTERDVLHRLQNLRKASKLPKAGKAATSPPRISDDHQRLLADLVVQEVGSLGKRDQLPYSPGFERLHHRFNEAAALAVQPHELWRLIAKLAK